MAIPRGFKAAANRIAVGLRHQMGLSDACPLRVEALARHRGIPVVPISSFADVQPECVRHLVERDNGSFSASLLHLPYSKLILVNDGHSFGRRSSDVAHELAHDLLGHPPQPLGHIRERRFDQGVEAEANWLAGAILIPNEAANKIVWSSLEPEAACDRYGVSMEMLNFRLNVSGARLRQQRANAKWRHRG